MTISYRFDVPLAPQGKKPRIRVKGTGHTYPDPRNGPLMAAVATFARAALPAERLEGPLRVDILAVIQRPKRLLRKKDPIGLCWCPQKPDKDNIEKLVFDAMKGCWGDDKQVCCGDTLTTYTALEGALARPQLRVKVTPLGDRGDFCPNRLAQALGLS